MQPPFRPDTVLPGFTAHALDLDGVDRELAEFATFLDTHTTLDERADILSFFAKRRQLSLFMGVYDVKLDDYNRLAYEYPLWGQFRTDLVVGDWDTRAYLFVEFEEAKRDSVFVTTRRQTREWSSTLEHGFGQIVDWLWLMDAQRGNDVYERKFGTRRADISTLLVVGRDQFVEPEDWLRLRWREENVAISGHRVVIRTYDGLLAGLRRKLDRGRRAL